jgi:hypothetical protein
MTKINENSLSAQVIIKLSVPTDTILIYGQQFYLDVTLNTNPATINFPTNIPLNVTATEGSGITISPIGDIPITNGRGSISGRYKVAIDSYQEGTIKNGQVSFTVTLVTDEYNIYNHVFSYHVKKILPHSLQLQYDRPVSVIPKEYTVPQINDSKETYVIYTAQLLEDTGNSSSKTPLKNTLVYINSLPDEDIRNNIIITSDPNAESNEPLTIYTPINYGEQNFIALTSDVNTGEIRFRVYSNNKPKPNSSTTDYKPILLSLTCIVLGQYNPYITESVCFIKPRSLFSFDILAPLYIPEENGGLIGSYSGEYTFEVNIQSDINYQPNDHLLFFTKEKNEIPDINSLILPIYRMKGINDIYTYSIPFKNFSVNAQSEIFYVIANRGKTIYSMRESIKYTGEKSNVPPGAASRIYNKVEVFSSYVNYSGDKTLSNPDELNGKLWEEEVTTCAQLANYINNGGNDAYLKITATNDLNDDTRPKVGDKVYVNMNIVAANKNTFQQITSVVLSSIPDQYPADNKTLCSTVVPIKHPLYSDISAFDNAYATVYFEYYTIDEDNRKIYSYTWNGLTDTSD